MTRVSALFDNLLEAELAIDELRSFGFPDDRLSFVVRHEEDGSDGDEENGETARDTTDGILTVDGFIVDQAGTFLPGVGPYIASGAIAHGVSITAEAMGSVAAAAGEAAGAMTGTVVGGLARVLISAGYEEDEADFYGSEVERGRVLVAVEPDDAIADNQAHAILKTHGGCCFQDDAG